MLEHVTIKTRSTKKKGITGSIVLILEMNIIIIIIKKGVHLLYIFCEGKLRNSISFEDGFLWEVQHNPGTTCILHLPVCVWLVSKTKSKNITNPLGNLMRTNISYYINLIIGDSILLGGLELLYDFLDVNGTDAKILEWRADEDFIFYDIHEWWVELVMRYVEFLCW